MSILKQAEEAARQKSPTETTAADVERARYLDAPVTEWELIQRCERAARTAVPRASEAEREDLAAELVQVVARKHETYRPARRLVAHKYLARRAAILAADRTDWRDQSRDRDMIELGESVLASADGAELPAESVDARDVADALGLDENGHAAIAAALSGWGSAKELAQGLGIGYAAARQRLSRGRAAIRARFPNPAELLAALDALLTDPGDPDILADLLAAVMRSGGYRLPHVPAITPEPRTTDGQTYPVECHTLAA